MLFRILKIHVFVLYKRRFFYIAASDANFHLVVLLFRKCYFRERAFSIFITVLFYKLLLKVIKWKLINEYNYIFIIIQ